MANVTDNNLEHLFHLADLPPEEQAILLSDIGNLILESAILRFLSESDDGTAEHFSHFVDAYADKDNLPELLSNAFPAFALILEEEAEAFRAEARRVLESQEDEA